MTDGLDALDGTQFLVGQPGVMKEFEAARHELDGLEQSAWGFAFPDLSERTPPEGFNQPVTR
jgi:hypothetical protein